MDKDGYTDYVDEKTLFSKYGLKKSSVSLERLFGDDSDNEEIKKLIEYSKKNKKITTLRLSYNTIQNYNSKTVDFQYIAQNITVPKLDLYMNHHGEDCIFHFALNNTLTTLDVGCNEIGNKHIKYFAENNKSITDLDLYLNEIDDDSAMYLSLNTTLKILNLSRNKITDIGAKYLAKNKTLTSLNLSMNNITYIGAFHFAINNSSIRILSLAYTQIRDIGAKLLSFNTTITDLNLNSNSLTDDSAMFLSLISNKLEKLSLYFNCIGEKGSYCLSCNKTITFLDLEENMLNNKCLEYLSTNSIIKVLNIKGNKRIDKLGIEYFFKNISLQRIIVEPRRCFDSDSNWNNIYELERNINTFRKKKLKEKLLCVENKIPILFEENDLNNIVANYVDCYPIKLSEWK